MKKQRIRMGVGLLLLSSNFFVGQFMENPSTFIDFLRGFATGIGLIFVLSSYFGRKRKSV
jgi:hypothetical protein